MRFIIGDRVMLSLWDDPWIDMGDFTKEKTLLIGMFLNRAT